jgi:ribosome biogenesis GTPase A
MKEHIMENNHAADAAGIDLNPQLNLQWYPGHMAKTRKMLNEKIALVEIVIELLDARIPFSSKNPDIDALAQKKHRIIVLNKADLADAETTKKWQTYYQERAFHVVITSSLSGKGLDEIIALSHRLMQPKIEALKARGRISYPIRAMIAGIPNVGKSTLINKYAGKTAAKTADRPGVTRGKQWIKMKNNFELLDTPGILWPKFDDKAVGRKLAFTGAINDDIIDMTLLAYAFISHIKPIAPDSLKQRYKIEFTADDSASVILDRIAEARGFKMKGNKLDLERAAITLLDEFRAAKLGRISLEMPQA